MITHRPVRRILPLALLASIVLVSCDPDDSDELSADVAAPLEVELEGGAVATPMPDTRIDIVRADDGSVAVLVDAEGVEWFARVEAIDELQVADLGLAPFEVGGASVLVTSRGGDDCRVYLEIEDGLALALIRPRAGIECPTAAGELEDWLPDVRPVLTLADDAMTPRASFGTKVGSFNGIDALSNGSVGHNSGSYSVAGLKWQCVEYVNRYYFQKLAHQNLKGTGNANNYYGTAAQKGLVAYANGGSVKPAVGDMLASNGAQGNVGHIALVREVGSAHVKVIHQNWSNSSSDDAKTLSMTTTGGKYTVAAFGSGYPVTGWLRRTGCTPTVSSVSPSSATLNTKTVFTASGSCLPSTSTAWIADCASFKVESTSSTQLKFSCTPSYSKGTKSGVVKHAADGTTLRTFNLTVN